MKIERTKIANAFAKAMEGKDPQSGKVQETFVIDADTSDIITRVAGQLGITKDTVVNSILLEYAATQFFTSMMETDMNSWPSDNPIHAGGMTIFPTQESYLKHQANKRRA